MAVNDPAMIAEACRQVGLDPAVLPRCELCREQYLPERQGGRWCSSRCRLRAWRAAQRVGPDLDTQA